MTAAHRSPLPPAPARGRAPTRERLLDAAERLFAERGYASTSIRDITADAACNVAAVNYHFGGKERLYAEMLRRRLRSLRDHRIARIRGAAESARPGTGLEDLLRAFTVAFLEPHLDQSGGRRLVQLISRELLEPHLRPGTFEREMMQPVRDELGRAIRSRCRGLGPAAARRCIHSIVAQLVHVVRLGQLPGAGGRGRRAAFSVPDVVDHIVRFSSAGIRAYGS